MLWLLPVSASLGAYDDHGLRPVYDDINRQPSALPRILWHLRQSFIAPVANCGSEAVQSSRSTMALFDVFRIAQMRLCLGKAGSARQPCVQDPLVFNARHSLPLQRHDHDRIHYYYQQSTSISCCTRGDDGTQHDPLVLLFRLLVGLHFFLLSFTSKMVAKFGSQINIHTYSSNSTTVTSGTDVESRHSSVIALFSAAPVR